jgi:hypothetical protein
MQPVRGKIHRRAGFVTPLWIALSPLFKLAKAWGSVDGWAAGRQVAGRTNHELDVIWRR